MDVAGNVRQRNNRICFAEMALQSVVLQKINDGNNDDDDDHRQSNRRPRRKNGIQQAISFNPEQGSPYPYPHDGETLFSSSSSSPSPSSSADRSNDEVQRRTDEVQRRTDDGRRVPHGLFRSAAACLAMAVCATVVFEFALVDVGVAVQRPMLVAMQLFCFVCLSYSLASCLRGVWIDEVFVAVFCVCVTVEFFACFLAAQDLLSFIFIQPLLTLLLLLSVGGVSMYLSLDVVHCAVVMVGITVLRFLACSTISDLPPSVKPLLAYCSGAVGIFAARYRVTAVHSVLDSCLGLSNKAEKDSCVEVDEAALKNSQLRMSPRRISLPNLIRKNAMPSSSPTTESTLLMEADGLLEDLIIDPAIPRHIVRVLNAVKSLLKQSASSVTAARRSKSIPHVSMSSSNGMISTHSFSNLPYTNDYVNLFSDEGIHRTTPSISLNRCSSFGIWSTTTSATGMPSVESELLGRSKFRMYGEESGCFGRKDRNWTIGDDEFENHHVADSGLVDRQNSCEKGSDGMPDVSESGHTEETGAKLSGTKLSGAEDLDHLSCFERSKARGTTPKHHIKFSESVRYVDKELHCGYENVNISDELENSSLLDVAQLQKWDYSIFELAAIAPDTLLCRVAHKIFRHLGFFDSFCIPVQEFLNYFHALELGYHNNPYHNRIHATDVLHAVFYMTTQPLAGFVKVTPIDDYKNLEDKNIGQNVETTSDGFDSCMRTNFLPLELMALYTAAAMHDYDHPGRTNAFLVTTCNPLAVLYNNRSVLESHHASAGWRLLLSTERHAWLSNLNNAQFKRFRFLVIEAILATDLARHFDLLAEFNTKINEEETPGVDWLLEGDRQMVSNMIIKMADINGPCKPKDLHKQWTYRISEEFYEQGDEEEALGLTISPYMNRHQPQLAKLQETFISHLVAPLCNSLSSAGLLPAVQADGQDGSTNDSVASFDSSLNVVCPMVQNMKENHRMWTEIIEKESLDESIGETGTSTHKMEANIVEPNIPSDPMLMKKDSDVV